MQGNTVIGLIRQTLDTLRGNRRYAKLKYVSELQWASLDELRAMQLEKMQSLLAHAVDTTEYYRAVLKELGATAEDFRTFEDFSRLPILTKSIVRENSEALISSSFSKQDLVPNSTGGSTGEPVAFYQNRQMWDIMNGTMMLCLSYMGWQPGDMVINIWGNPKEFGGKTNPLGKFKAWIGGNITLNAYQYDKSVLADWVKVIGGYRRVFIYGYPSVLSDLANHLSETGVELPGVKGVMSSAEKLHDWQRDLLAKAFSCGVYDQYGSREIPGIGVECEKGSMHLLTHVSYVEFLPDPQSDSQKIIATSLVNHGMPFIRYDIGDCGEPQAGACSCGRGFPLMKMDIGRIYDRFLTPEGNAIHGTYFVRLLAAVEGVEAFQYCQQEVHRINLKIVRGGAFSAESQAVVDGLEERIRADVTPSLSLDVEYVDDIPRTGGGKHRYIICEVEQ